MKQRIESILKALKEGTYERDEAMALSLLAALSGESIFMLGLPGVGKSMIARRLKSAFRNASVFEYLMSRFSTPDEIFGPVSISKLKDADCYERVTAGYLPEAEVVFLDEIWKAGPAIQNSLLTVLNEKIYLNGNNEMALPVKAIISASNELLAEGEGLEALWDRFLIRYIVEPISRKDNFFRLIDPPSYQRREPDFTPLSDDDYYRIRQLSATIELPDNIKELLYNLRQRMNELGKENDEEDEDEDGQNKFYVSDRRWKKIAGVLRTSALLNGRNAVDLSDLLLLDHMIWNDDGEIPKLRGMIAECIVASLFADMLGRHKNITVAAKKKPKTGGDTLYSPDGRHYHILCDDFVLSIRIDDYEKMKEKPNEFFFASETADSRIVLGEKGQYSVRVPKPGCVCINSYNYPLVTVNGSYRGEASAIRERLDSLIDALNKGISDNLFVADSAIRTNIHYMTNSYRKRFEFKAE